MKFVFLDRFSKKKNQISDLMKIRSAVLCRRTDRHDEVLPTCLKMEIWCGQTTKKQEELSVLFTRFIRNGICWSEELSRTCLQLEREDGNVCLHREGMRYVKFRAVACFEGCSLLLPFLPKSHLVQTLHNQFVLRDSAPLMALLWP